MALKDLFTKTKAAESDEQANKKMMRELGVEGELVFDGFKNEEQRADKTTIKDYRKMRDTDATVDALFNIVTYPIIAATHGVKADPDDEGEEQAEFIRKALFEPPHRGGMGTPFSLVLEQILHAVYEGFSLFERVYMVDSNGRMSLKKLARRDTTTLKLIRTNNGEYGGVHQEATFGDKKVDVVLPAQKTFLFTYGKASDYLYGRSAFKPIYRNWDKKRKLEYFDSIAIQSKAVTPKILKKIDNAITKKGGIGKKVLRALAKLGELKSAMRLPAGFDIEELKGGNNEGVHESIERQNSEMAREFLANFMLAGSQGAQNVGSYNLSSNQSDIFMIGLKGVMNLIVEHINYYWIADLIDLNFPVGKRHYPEFYFDNLTSDTMEFLRAVFTKLIEKDKISDEAIEGIEKQVASRLEIDIGSPDDKSNAKKEDVAEPADKFPRAKEDVKSEDEIIDDEIAKYEIGVKFDAIEKWLDKAEAGFEKAAKPILEDYLDSVAKNPNNEIKLPDAYTKLLTSTYKTAYNYGKLTASDESGVGAPKTTEQQEQHTQDFVDFIVQKQTDDIKAIIDAEKLKLPVKVSEIDLDSEDYAADILRLLASLLVTAFSVWLVQAVTGTRDTIANQAFNCGRIDAVVAFSDEKDQLMWSSRMEKNTCAICRTLHSSTYFIQDALKIGYLPGHVHFGCRCIWIRLFENNLYNLPDPTGRPDDLDEVAFMQLTKKGELQRIGLVGKNQTKIDAIRAKQLNNENNGATMKKVEANIRNNALETLAAFDRSGKKLADFSSGGVDNVKTPDFFDDFMKKNGISILTHNHPGGSSFSDVDLVTASNLGLDEIRAVSSKYTYSIKPGKDGWPSAEDITSKYGQLREQYIDAAELLVAAGKLDAGDAAWQWATNKILAGISDEFMLKYSRSEP